MPKRVLNSNQLIECVLHEDGLYDVSCYLQHKTSKPVVICNNIGHVCAKTTNALQSMVCKQEIQDIPPKPVNGAYVYDQSLNYLYYFVGNNEVEAVVILLQIQEDMIEAALPSLDETSLSIRVYFTRRKAVEQVEMHKRNQLVNDLLINNIINIKDILRHSDKQLDANLLYFIVIIEPTDSSKLYDLYSYSKDWLRIHELDILVCTWIDSLMVYICPTHYVKTTLEENYLWKQTRTNVMTHVTDMENKFGIQFSAGAGQKYPLQELHKSYQEAMLAIKLSRLLGYEHSIKHFWDFGAISLLTMIDDETLKSFCYKYIGKLLEYDNNNNGELLNTLRNLFACNMSWKETACSMFIHVNTLRYRINKIEEILILDLGKMEHQANLFIALNIWDSLNMSGVVHD